MNKNCVRFIFNFAVLTTLFFLASENLSAQTAATKAERVEPFKIGETLNYEVKYSRLLLRGIEVADLSFTINAAPNAPNKIKIKGEVVSKGGLLKLVSYNFLQKFDSLVQTDDFRILQTVRYDQQEDRVRNSEANFDYTAQKVTYREVDPKNPMRPPRMISSPLDGGAAHDLISAFYFIRRQPLAVGKDLTVKISDSGVVYEIPVKITAREQQKSVLGKIWTLRVEPQIFGSKGLLAGEGKMIIWMTDDARHLPVRAQINASIGKIEIKLRRTENLQQLAVSSEQSTVKSKTK